MEKKPLFFPPLATSPTAMWLMISLLVALIDQQVSVAQLLIIHHMST